MTRMMRMKSGFIFFYLTLVEINDIIFKNLITFNCFENKVIRYIIVVRIFY